MTYCPECGSKETDYNEKEQRFDCKSCSALFDVVIYSEEDDEL